jgi:soluble cytochrome b562
LLALTSRRTPLKNGKTNGLMSYEQLHELLQMTALQTSENAKQIKQTQKQLRKSISDHDREMKDIRSEMKKLIQRIAI